MDIEKVGKLIKEKRLNKGLTQKELADMLYITDRAVSKWERGISLPDISILKKLSEILDIDLNEMLEVKSAYEKKISNIKMFFILGVLILVIIILFLFINKEDDINNEYVNCDKELVNIYSNGNISIYTNCLDNVYINGNDLKKLLSNGNFDIEDWILSLDYVGSFWDGGSIMYQSSHYKVLRCNTIGGNQDIIIGSLDMEYEDIFCKTDVEIYQKCYYTDIFRVIDILDDYPVDDNDYIFITLDQFQDHNPVNIKINKNFAGDLEINNYYEFKFLYYLPNEYNMTNTYDAFYNYELVSILNTSKEGLQQVSTNTCKKLVK